LIIKLTVSFILLIIIVAGLAFFYTYSESKDALKERMQDELKTVASVTATQINGDMLASLKAGDENTTEFLAIRDQLDSIRKSSPDIKYVYTMKKVGDEVQFIVDADYGILDNPGTIGEVYEEADSDLLEGFSKPTATQDFYTDEWGTLLSGFAPVKDSGGNVVGLVGVDMDSQSVINQQNFIGSTIYWIVGVSVVIAGIIIGFFVMTIMRDINKLNKAADLVSKGNMDVVVDVKRKDEVGALAESFSRMVASLKFERMMHEEDMAAAKAVAPEIRK
jgi:adenylate cyclase